jgi:hypothetical protein
MASHLRILNTMTVPELLEFTDKVHDSATHLLRRAQSRIKTRGVSKTEQTMREVEELMVIRNRLEAIYREPLPIHSSNTESMRLRNDMFTLERLATSELIDALGLLFRHNLDPLFINNIRSILNSYNRSSSMLSRQPPNENIRASLPQGAPVLTRQPRIDLSVNIGGKGRKYRKNTSFKLSKCKYGQCHKKKTRRNNKRR